MAPRCRVVASSLAIFLFSSALVSAGAESADAVAAAAGTAPSTPVRGAQHAIAGLHVPVRVYWRGDDPRNARVRMCALPWSAYHASPPLYPFFADLVAAHNCERPARSRTGAVDEAAASASNGSEAVPTVHQLRALHANVGGAAFDPTLLPVAYDTTLGQLEEEYLTSRCAAVAASGDVDLGCQPAAYVYHEMRCGSTLTMNMLASLSSSIVYSEAGPTDSILLHRSMDDDTKAHWLRVIVAAMGRPVRWIAAGGARDAHTGCRGDDAADASSCWTPVHMYHKAFYNTVMDAKHMRDAFPRMPWVFVQRQPLQVMMSLLRETERSPGVHDLTGHINTTHFPVLNDSICMWLRDDPPAFVLNVTHTSPTGNRWVTHPEDYCGATLAYTVASALRAGIVDRKTVFARALLTALLVQDVRRTLLSDATAAHIRSRLGGFSFIARALDAGVPAALLVHMPSSLLINLEADVQLDINSATGYALAARSFVAQHLSHLTRACNGTGDADTEVRAGDGAGRQPPALRGRTLLQLAAPTRAGAQSHARADRAALVRTVASDAALPRTVHLATTQRTVRKASVDATQHRTTVKAGAASIHAVSGTSAAGAPAGAAVRKSLFARSAQPPTSSRATVIDPNRDAKIVSRASFAPQGEVQSLVPSSSSPRPASPRHASHEPTAAADDADIQLTHPSEAMYLLWSTLATIETLIPTHVCVRGDVYARVLAAIDAVAAQHPTTGEPLAMSDVSFSGGMIVSHVTGSGDIFGAGMGVVVDHTDLPDAVHLLVATHMRSTVPTHCTHTAAVDTLLELIDEAGAPNKVLPDVLRARMSMIGRSPQYAASAPAVCAAMDPLITPAAHTYMRVVGSLYSKARATRAQIRALAHAPGGIRPFRAPHSGRLRSARSWSSMDETGAYVSDTHAKELLAWPTLKIAAAHYLAPIRDTLLGFNVPPTQDEPTAGMNFSDLNTQYGSDATVRESNDGLYALVSTLVRTLVGITESTGAASLDELNTLPAEHASMCPHRHVFPLPDVLSAWPVCVYTPPITEGKYDTVARINATSALAHGGAHVHPALDDALASGVPFLMVAIPRADAIVSRMEDDAALLDAFITPDAFVAYTQDIYRGWPHLHTDAHEALLSPPVARASTAIPIFRTPVEYDPSAPAAKERTVSYTFKQWHARAMRLCREVQSSEGDQLPLWWNNHPLVDMPVITHYENASDGKVNVSFIAPAFVRACALPSSEMRFISCPAHRTHDGASIAVLSKSPRSLLFGRMLDIVMQAAVVVDPSATADTTAAVCLAGATGHVHSAVVGQAQGEVVVNGHAATYARLLLVLRGYLRILLQPVHPDGTYSEALDVVMEPGQALLVPAGMRAMYIGLTFHILCESRVDNAHRTPPPATHDAVRDLVPILAALPHMQLMLQLSTGLAPRVPASSPFPSLPASLSMDALAPPSSRLDTNTLMRTLAHARGFAYEEHVPRCGAPLPPAPRVTASASPHNRPARSTSSVAVASAAQSQRAPPTLVGPSLIATKGRNDRTAPLQHSPHSASSPAHASNRVAVKPTQLSAVSRVPVRGAAPRAPGPPRPDPPEELPPSQSPMASLTLPLVGSAHRDMHDSVLAEAAPVSKAGATVVALTSTVVYVQPHTSLDASTYTYAWLVVAACACAMLAVLYMRTRRPSGSRIQALPTDVHSSASPVVTTAAITSAVVTDATSAQDGPTTAFTSASTHMRARTRGRTRDEERKPMFRRLGADATSSAGVPASRSSAVEDAVVAAAPAPAAVVWSDDEWGWGDDTPSTGGPGRR